jgi:hypothetical protein
MNRDEYKEQIDELHALAAQCDAWRLFLTDETMRCFRGVKARLNNWYGRYDSLTALCECTEGKLRDAIGLMTHAPTFDFEFLRHDIYDPWAIAEIPLSCFVCVDPAVKPAVRFGIKLPWVVSEDDFKIVRRQKHHRQLDVMVFEHAQLSRRSEGARWCAEIEYDAGKTKEERFAVLMAEVRGKAAQYLVTIEPGTQKKVAEKHPNRKRKFRRWVEIGRRDQNAIYRLALEAGLEVVTCSKANFCCWYGVGLYGTPAQAKAFDSELAASGQKSESRMLRGAWEIYIDRPRAEWYSVVIEASRANRIDNSGGTRTIIVHGQTVTLPRGYRPLKSQEEPRDTDIAWNDGPAQQWERIDLENAEEKRGSKPLRDVFHAIARKVKP